MSVEPVPMRWLAEMERYSTPTIANAIETFDVRPRSEGFLDATVRHVAGGPGPWTAYAATARMRSAQRSDDAVPLVELLRHIAELPEPRVVVVEDLDERPVGALWGEVMANIHRAHGCVGAVTNGGVRDIDEVGSLGFRFYASSVLVSHAHAHLVEVGAPVRVGGMVVEPGALLHGDAHGVVEVPRAIAGEVAAAAHAVETTEREIIGHVRQGRLDVERFGDFLAAYE